MILETRTSLAEQTLHFTKLLNVVNNYCFKQCEESGRQAKISDTKREMVTRMCGKIYFLILHICKMDDDMRIKEYISIILLALRV